MTPDRTDWVAAGTVAPTPRGDAHLDAITVE
jgi:hypothetical protein